MNEVEFETEEIYILHVKYIVLLFKINKCDTYKIIDREKCDNTCMQERKRNIQWSDSY